MQRVKDMYVPPSELVLGKRLNARVPESDQKRQRQEVDEILARLRSQPGLILADEVGMGKTFVALAVAFCVAENNPRGPVVVLAPSNLIAKWEQDLKVFCELYLENRRPLSKENAPRSELTRPEAFRYAVARHSIEFLKLLDDPARERCHMIFLAQGAMTRNQTDKWIRLALIAETLRRHARGKAERLIQVSQQIHRFLARLLYAVGVEQAHGWGEELWQKLLKSHVRMWKGIYNEHVHDERKKLADDPVPKSVKRAIARIKLHGVAEELKKMPVRARGGEERTAERLNEVRNELKAVEMKLWSELLSKTRWRSPLMVMDEAHHLKNPATALSRQFISSDWTHELKTGDGAMAQAFDRMLFLTATPFQLGHHELVRVLERFGDVRWDKKELGDPENFRKSLDVLSKHLNDCQRTAIAFQRSWSRLRIEDCVMGDPERWWKGITQLPRESLPAHERAVLDAYEAAKACRNNAQKALRPWLIRHNKGDLWSGTDILRRQRFEGAIINGKQPGAGLPVPSKQMLPFFLAARSAVTPGKDLLGEALCSSYEAFRYTRKNRLAGKDTEDEQIEPTAALSQSDWYLQEFDRALRGCGASVHPKICATVSKAVDLWEEGEKVLVFAFYLQTCSALRLHISQEIERRMMSHGARRILPGESLDQLVRLIQKRFFDDANSIGRRALDAAIDRIVSGHEKAISKVQMPSEQQDILKRVMRRFLRVTTTLVRCFPLGEHATLTPSRAVEELLNYEDGSHFSWRIKFDGFIEFLTERCSAEERALYLEAARRTQTGGIRVGETEDEEAEQDSEGSKLTLANVQVATGNTAHPVRARLMRAFNTPFFPDILVCSEVMGEGVDLQRFCRHVIHHDLAWNPSVIEQRTGRIDRLGCKAQARSPINIYLPFIDGTADERQFRVMSDRERWFRVVMGQEEVAKLIAADSSSMLTLPGCISDELSFKLGIN